MSVKDTARRLYIRIIDDASQRYIGHKNPNEGWLATMRKALDMSGPQLAKRAGVTKTAIYQAERKEVLGEVTLNQMEKMATAMGGRFVYSVIPDSGHKDIPHQSEAVMVSDLVRAQARMKAEALIGRVSTHMGLEKQALSDELNKAEIDRLAEKLEREMPLDFWERSDV